MVMEMQEVTFDVVRNSSAADLDCAEFTKLIDTMIVGGIPTARVTRAELAEMMLHDCRMARAGALAHPRVVISSNGAVIARYHGDWEFRQLVAQADIVDADGAPLVIASRWLTARPLPERVATTDLIHDCSALAAENGVRFFFLGGRPGVAFAAAKRLGSLYPGLQVAGCRDGYFGEGEEVAIRQCIKDAGTDILWLGLGSPAQERLATRWRRELAGVAWIRTCGGLFDHVAGNVSRAPVWMQEAGLEWLHRMRQEPRRLGPRYLSTNPIAAFHLLTKTRG